MSSTKRGGKRSESDFYGTPAWTVRRLLEAVEAGILSFEDAFLAHVVLPDGRTVGGWLGPQLAEAYSHRKMPPLLTEGA